MTSTPLNQPPARRGVVAVIRRETQLLVIRRSLHVAAPGALCFPGGGMEAGECEQRALRRELLEELNVQVQPVRRLWESRTAWNVSLAWWLTGLDPAAPLIPDPAEVAAVYWMTAEEIRTAPDVLSSNLEFLDACQPQLGLN